MSERGGVPAPEAVQKAITENLTEFPCRCGKTHRGDYGIYDFGHHMCFHEMELLWLHFDPETGCSVMCPQCGNVWSIQALKDNGMLVPQSPEATPADNKEPLKL